MIVRKMPVQAGVLDRRIENVMQVPRLKNNFGTVFSGVFDRFTAFRQFRGSNRGRKRWGV